MNDFLLTQSAAKLRKLSYSLKDEKLGLFTDLMPVLFAYSIYARGCFDGTMEVSDRSDKYFQLVSGLSTAKWKASKAFLVKQGWISYDRAREGDGKITKWKVKIHPEFMGFYTKFNQAVVDVSDDPESTSTEINPVDFATGLEINTLAKPPSGKLPPYNDKEDYSNDKEGLGIEDQPSVFENSPVVEPLVENILHLEKEDIHGFDIAVYNHNELEYFTQVLEILKGHKQSFNHFLSVGDVEGKFTLDESMGIFLRGLYSGGKTFSSHKGLIQLIDHHVEFCKNLGSKVLVQPDFSQHEEAAARIEELIFQDGRSGNVYFGIPNTQNTCFIDEDKRDEFRATGRKYIASLLSRGVVDAEKLLATVLIRHAARGGVTSPAYSDMFLNRERGWYYELREMTREDLDELWDEDYQIKLEKLSKKHNINLNEYKSKI